MTAFHDSTDQEAGLAAARTALQNTRSGDMRKGSAIRSQCGSASPVRPWARPKIGSVRCVIGKQLLKLRERLGESQIVALVDLDSRHDAQTLALVGTIRGRDWPGEPVQPERCSASPLPSVAIVRLTAPDTYPSGR